MDRYMIFNVEKFLKDSKKWSSERKALVEKYEDLLGLKALSQDTPVQTSNVSDTTGNVALKLAEIKDEIDRLDYYDCMLRRALADLSDVERDLINVFFFSSGFIYARVDEYAYKYGRSIPSVYIDRREVLKKLSELLTEK